MTRKNLLVLVLALTTILFAATPLPGMAQDDELGTLLLRFTNIPTNDGVIRVILFNSKDRYPEKPIRTATLKPQNGEAWMPFPNLDYEKLVYVWYHDLNGNNELDKNWLNMIQEPRGYSNDATSLFGRPSYEDAEFVLSPESDNVHIIDMTAMKTTTSKVPDNG